MAITIHNIARIAGVSATTVSLVLNSESNRISKKTSEKILAIAEEHNYKPNRIAVSLATKKTFTMGIILPDLSNLFFSELAGIIEKTAYKNGYSLFLCTSGESIEKCVKYLVEMERRCVDGIFLIPPSCINSDDNHISMQKALDSCTLPYILIERAIHDVFHDFVTSDNDVGGYIATKHLIELGHRKIGCLTGPLTEYGANRRLAGYKAAMQEHNLPVPESFIYEGDFHMESGIAGASKLIASGVSAIFAENDMMAVGVLQEAFNQGISVPQALSIIGYDNNPITKLLGVQLTTIGQPVELMGRRACEILLDKINDVSDIHRDYYFSPTLIQRQSTAELKNSRL